MYPSLVGCRFSRLLLFPLGTASSSLPYLCHGHLSRNTAAILTSLGFFFGGEGVLRGDTSGKVRALAI